MATPEKTSNGRMIEGYQPRVDRGYQPTASLGAPNTQGYQPTAGPTNSSPKPPSGGTAIQPPSVPTTTKK